jgi:hypothetical protein
MWERTAPIYSPGDGQGLTRQPSRDAVPSSWVVRSVAAAKQANVGVTLAVVLGTIYLLGRHK